MSNFKLPIFSITIAGKGGVGKSLLSLLYLDLCELNGIQVQAMQLDDQSRLEKALKRNVISLDMRTAKRSRIDPKAIIKTFSPLHDEIERMSSSRVSLHLDVGATQQHALFDYSALVGLNDDIVEFGICSIAFILVTADAEAIEQAARSIKTLQSVLPSINPLIILNERDGSFSEMPHGSEAARNFRTLLEPILTTVSSVRMPQIPAGSWQNFERQSLRFLEAVSMDTQAVMAATGLSRPESKLARGDVQAAFDVVEEELSKHIHFFRTGEAS